MDIKRLAASGVYTALIAMLTFFPRIPVPATGGYIHLGDSLIYLAAILYGGAIGGLTAGIGSAIVDLLVAPVYAVPTLIIKGLMGLTAGIISGEQKTMNLRNFIAMMVSGLIMVVGYGVCDAIMSGSFAVALSSGLMNLVQYAMGVSLGALLLYSINKAKIIR